jgi:arsenate reductase (glutaredoxin)
MIQVFGHGKCKGTRAALRFFSDRRIPVQSVDILEKGLSRGELTSVARALGVGALLDRAGARFRDRGLAHSDLKDERVVELLLEDGRLYRTPIVRHGGTATVGVDEATWRAWVSELRGG